MTRCCNNGILRGDLRFALCIREQLFADGASPVFRIACFGAGGSFRVSLGQDVCSHGECHISDLARAVCIRELFVADAALPIFDTAGSSAGRLDAVVMLRRMRFFIDHAGFGVITSGAGVLLRAGRRAGRICYGFPFAECMIRLGVIRVEGTASIAFFPVLRIVMLADEGMVGLCTVFSLADIADGLCLAGSGSAAVFGLVQFCVADRADVPVIGAVIAPCCRRSMACCFFYNRIFIRDLGRAVLIREPLFAGGAGPIRRVAIFRAGRVLCGNSSQRVAD